MDANGRSVCWRHSRKHKRSSALQVLRFVLDAVRAEAFNEKRTLFLFGSYTIGKEKLFLEVASILKQKACCAVALTHHCSLH